jgi:phosphopantothenoylcysteine decarboxylase/phosphopantothenate--cysteine ligase
MLITAGPTHEPIDAVRFIGNRSSGRMGLALARAASSGGWQVTLLLGPVGGEHDVEGVRLRRFRTCEDLRGLLREECPACDVLVMAAAVADYRPKVDPAFLGGKFRRQDQKLVLELEPTPDLLAEVAAYRRDDQLFVGFALEPRQELEASARLKMERKRVDLVVGNPLETMDSPSIEAMVLSRDGSVRHTPGVVPKADFARWLVGVIGEELAALRARRA